MTSTLLKSSVLNHPTICKLDNGLTIIAEQMPVDAVNFNVWLNVGSAKESDRINGMAHFLEHMIFKGTPRLALGEFERSVEERGAITNAATSQDYTHYFITTAPQDFAILAPLQLDVVLNPLIDDNAFDRERYVVLEEIRRSDDNPSRRTFSRAMEVCFDELPYRRPVLGPSSVIEGLQPQQMRDFRNYWYQPDRIHAVAVGNLPVEELIEIVATSFSNTYTPRTVPDYPEIPPNSIPEANFQTIVRREYIDDKMQQARLVMMWKVPGIAELEQTYALDVLAVILGQGKVSRLFRELREERGLVNQIGASNMTQESQGVFYISAQLPSENIDLVEAAIVAQIERLQREPINLEDINRIRTQVANRFIFGNERPSDRANLYGYYSSHLGTLEPALNYPSYIQALSVEELQQAARKYLPVDAYASIVLRPDRG
jgi:predicted Zn-dependent peptidase